VGKASWISSKYGKGKIIAFGPHPEKRYPVLENALFYTTGKKQRTETINSHNFSFIEKIYTITNNITISKNQSKDFCELRDIITKIHNHNISILLNNIKENLSNNPPKILISNGKFPDGYSAIYLFHEETNDLINAFTNFDYVYELLENLETSSNEKQKIEQYKSDMKNLLGKIEKIKLEQKVYLEKFNNLVNNLDSLICKIQLIILCQKMRNRYDYSDSIFTEIYKMRFKTLQLLRQSWYQYETLVALSN